MRTWVKVIVAALAMILLYGVLFTGPAFAATKAKRQKTVLAGAAPTAPGEVTSTPQSSEPPANASMETAPPAAAPEASAAPSAATAGPMSVPQKPMPKAPTIASDIATTDQCFAKYTDQCEVESCLLTLERESQEAIDDVFGRCRTTAEAQPAANASTKATTAAAAPPAQ